MNFFLAMTRWFDVLIYISLFQSMLLYFCWLLDDERTNEKQKQFISTHTESETKQKKTALKMTWLYDIIDLEFRPKNSSKNIQITVYCLLDHFASVTQFFSFFGVDFYFFLLMNFDRIDKVNTHTEKKQCVNFSIMLLLLLAADDIIK